MTRLPVVLALAWVMGWSLLPSSFARTPGEVGINQALPEASLLGLNGRSRQLSAFRGRPLIINVWASWCGPCRAEMASLERLAWSALGSRVAIIGISTDDDRQAALAWLQASNATLSHFIDRQLEMEQLLGANRIPLTVLVDAQGRVVEKVYGAREWDSPESIGSIERALKLAKPVPRPAR